MFENHVCIITGGTSGIGLATAREMLKRGARVMVLGRNEERLHKALAELRPLGRVEGLSLDVSSESDMKRMADETSAKFGRIDSLVACAASGGSHAKARNLPFSVAQMPVEDWDEVMGINLKGIIYSNKAVIPAMTEHGGGTIINVSSARGGRYGLPMAAAYAASKRAIVGFSEVLEQDLREHGIRVEVVFPDVTETPMMSITGGITPDGMMKPATVAVLIADMVLSPDDTLYVDPVIAPFGGWQLG